LLRHFADRRNLATCRSSWLERVTGFPRFASRDRLIRNMSAKGITNQAGVHEDDEQN
jgi:hypothetical protein